MLCGRERDVGLPCVVCVREIFRIAIALCCVCERGMSDCFVLCGRERERCRTALVCLLLPCDALCEGVGDGGGVVVVVCVGGRYTHWYERQCEVT